MKARDLVEMCENYNKDSLNMNIDSYLKEMNR